MWGSDDWFFWVGVAQKTKSFYFFICGSLWMVSIMKYFSCGRGLRNQIVNFLIIILVSNEKASRNFWFELTPIISKNLKKSEYQSNETIENHLKLHESPHKTPFKIKMVKIMFTKKIDEIETIKTSLFISILIKKYV